MSLSPKPGESKAEFLRRFNSDLVMVAEHGPFQRRAMAEEAWRRAPQVNRLGTLTAQLKANARRRGGDPSYTKMLQHSYERALSERWERVQRKIIQTVVVNDALGLGDGLQRAAQIGPASRFDFPSDEGKTEAFIEWMQELMEHDVLEVQNPGRWTDTYVRPAYARGVEHANFVLEQNGFEIPRESLDRTFNSPVHSSKLQLLFTRNFRELKGITEATGQQISRVLTEGMAEGVNPREMGRRIGSAINRVGKRRGTVMARTEVIRAHSHATLRRFEDVGVTEVTVLAEFRTAGDDRVCSTCAGFEGTRYKVGEAYGLIPIHPQCRCVWLPIQVPSDQLPEPEPEASIPPVPRRFPSFEEAASWIEENFEGTDKFDFHHLDNLAPELQSSLISGYRRVENRLPGFLRTIDRPLEVDTGATILGPQEMMAYEMSQMHTALRTVYLNSRFMEDAGGPVNRLAVEAMRRAEKTGFSVPSAGDGFEGGIVHEFGHHLHFLMRQADTPDLEKIESIEQLRALPTPRVDEFLKKASSQVVLGDKKMSQYAQTDEDEWFAEMFKAWVYGQDEYVPDGFDDLIREYLDDPNFALNRLGAEIADGPDIPVQPFKVPRQTLDEALEMDPDEMRKARQLAQKSRRGSPTSVTEAKREVMVELADALEDAEDLEDFDWAGFWVDRRFRVREWEVNPFNDMKEDLNHLLWSKDELVQLGRELGFDFSGTDYVDLQMVATDMQRLLDNWDDMSDPDWYQAISDLIGRSPTFTTGLRRKTTKEMIRQWAQSSGDAQALSISMQMAIRDEFNLDDADLYHLKFSPAGNVSRAWEDATRFYNENPEFYRAFARAQYDRTQEYLEENGVEWITLARGSRWGGGEDWIPDTWDLQGDMSMQPASSFSGDMEIALSFSGGGFSSYESSVVTVMRVPRGRLLSCPQTGWGCLREAEWLMLGGDNLTALNINITKELVDHAKKKFPASTVESSLFKFIEDAMNAVRNGTYTGPSLGLLR